MSRFEPVKIRGMFPEELEAVEWIVERLNERHIAALHDLMAFDTTEEWFTPAEIGVSSRMLWSLNDFGRIERGCQSPLSLVQWQDGRPRRWAISPLGVECLGRALANNQTTSTES